MQMKTVVALGLSQAVAAQNSTAPVTTASSATSASASASESVTATSASASASASIDPSDVSPFSFLGCFGSTDGFAGLALIDVDGEQTLENCADSCADDYFGVYFESCYCGDDFNESTSIQEDDGACDVPCPGDDSGETFCGGLADSAAPARKNRRQVDADVLLSIFVRAGVINGDGNNSNNDNDNSDNSDNSVDNSDNSDNSVDNSDNSDNSVDNSVDNSDNSVDNSIDNSVEINCYGGICAPFVCQGESVECEDNRIICEGDNCYIDASVNTINNQNGTINGDIFQDVEKVIIKEGETYRWCQEGECENKITCHGGSCVVEECPPEVYNQNLVVHGENDYTWEPCTEYCHVKVECTAECYPKPQPVGPPTPPVAPPAHAPATPPANNSPVAPPANNSPVAPPANNSPVAPPANNSPATPPSNNSPATPPSNNSPAAPPANRPSPVATPPSQGGSVVQNVPAGSSPATVPQGEHPITGGSSKLLASGLAALGAVAGFVIML